MEAPSTVFSHCKTCEHKLEHTALFCSICGATTCSWQCHVDHVATHAKSPPATESDTSTSNECPDQTAAAQR